MMNNYKIFGLIVSLMRKDNPPELSKDFSENVMQKISLTKRPFYINYHNFLKIAASVFFAVITAYSLISFEQSETNVVSVDIIKDNNDNKELIKRVNDDSACIKAEENVKEENDSCK